MRGLGFTFAKNNFLVILRSCALLGLYLPPFFSPKQMYGCVPNPFRAQQGPVTPSNVHVTPIDGYGGKMVQ